MPGSKPGALPLGDGPTNAKTFFIYTEQEVPEKLKLQLRTCACQDQNLVPYPYLLKHGATAQQTSQFIWFEIPKNGAVATYLILLQQS